MTTQTTIKTNLLPPTLCKPQGIHARLAVAAALSRIYARHCKAKNAKHSPGLILAPHMDQ